MLDIKFIRENPDKVKKGVADKQLDPKLVDEILRKDEELRGAIQAYQTARTKWNSEQKITEKLGREKGFESLEAKRQIEKARLLNKDRKHKWNVVQKLKREKGKLHVKIPNFPADDVKVGKDESENEVIRKHAEPTKFDFEPKDHLALGEALDIIDVKRAAKVSGTRFGYLKGDAVLLQFALIQLAFEMLMKEGFTPIIPPILIKKDSMAGMGYLEHGGEEDMYVLEEDSTVLVGTSEQSIGPMHKNEIFKASELPKRYVGFSSCFRREAGTYGKDTRGIMRLHQFDKVEMFSYTKPEESDKEHEYLLGLEEKLFQVLNIPYQIVKMCTGDLGAPAARKFDLEAWMPGQGKYREVTSTSNCTDFQSRRLKIKYQEKGGTRFVHTLNATAFAIGRTVIAIMENYQQKDGSIIVPEVLKKWVGKERVVVSK
jgi:seryl-tRNA synthetase